MPDVGQLLSERLGDAVTKSVFRDNVRYVVPVERLLEALTLLKSAGFDFLSDIAGIDYLHYPNATDRYGIVYC